MLLRCPVRLVYSIVPQSVLPKCSSSWISVHGLPLFLIGYHALPYFPASFFFQSYIWLASPSLPATCAIINRSPVYFHLLALMYRITRLFAPVCMGLGFCSSCSSASECYLLESWQGPDSDPLLMMLLLPLTTLWHIVGNASLIPINLLFILVFSSLSRSCGACNLLLTAILHSSCISVSRSKLVLKLWDTVSLVVQCFSSFSFLLATAR